MMELQILIVDDSPAMRSFIRRVLELSGLVVGRYFTAANGEDALRLLDDNWVDAVLTDINMPRMDGEELLRRMSEDPVLRFVPVVVVSTDRTEGRIRNMLALGAKGYVTKPFTPEALRAELEHSLGVDHEPNELQAALTSAVEEVLETMCFTGVLTSASGPAPQAADSDPELTAELHIEGHICGRFRVGLPLKLAYVLSAAFLGREQVEVADGETREVVCELANMMCGSALSRVDTKAIFQLTHPEITAREQCGRLRRPAANRWFDLGVGMLTVSLELQKLS